MFLEKGQYLNLVNMIYDLIRGFTKHIYLFSLNGFVGECLQRQCHRCVVFKRNKFVCGHDVICMRNNSEKSKSVKK